MIITIHPDRAPEVRLDNDTWIIGIRPITGIREKWIIINIALALPAALDVAVCHGGVLGDFVWRIIP